MTDVLPCPPFSKSSLSKIVFTWLSHSKTRVSRRDRTPFPGRMRTCHSGDQIEKNELGWECSPYGEGKSVYRVFGVGNLMESDRLEDPAVDRRVKWDRFVDWIDLARDRDRWRALAIGGNEPSGSIRCGEFLD